MDRVASHPLLSKIVSIFEYYAHSKVVISGSNYTKIMSDNQMSNFFSGGACSQTLQYRLHKQTMDALGSSTLHHCSQPLSL